MGVGHKPLLGGQRASAHPEVPALPPEEHLTTRSSAPLSPLTACEWEQERWLRLLSWKPQLRGPVIWGRGGGLAEERAFETGIFHAPVKANTCRFKTTSQYTVVFLKEWMSRPALPPYICVSQKVLTVGRTQVKHQILGSVLSKSPYFSGWLMEEEGT